MRHMTKLALVVGTAVAITLGGSVYAFADWVIDAPPTVLKMRVAAMPAGNAPSVAMNGKNTAIDWVGNKIVAGVKVESYIVTRFGAGDPVVVCDHVTATACKDKAVPGGTWTWKVQPVFQAWIGEYSPHSVALSFSGPPPTAADLVSATSPAAPAATPPGTGTAVVPSPPTPAVTAKPPPATAPPEQDEAGSPPPAVEESTPVEPAPPSAGPVAGDQQ